MGRFVVEEFKFELDGFKETSTQILADVDGPRATFGVTITRSALRDRDLGEFIDDELGKLAKGLPGMHVTDKNLGIRHGLPCADVSARTRVPGGMLHQRIVAFDWAGKAVMLTATSPMRLKDKANKHLDAVLATLKFRKPPAGSP